MRDSMKQWASRLVIFALAVVATLVVQHLLGVGGAEWALAVPNIIVLVGSPKVKEGVASEAITPGHLIEWGGANDLQKHSTAAGNARKAFADVADLIGDGIADDYATGDQVKYVVAERGDEIYALVADGATAITKGAALESAGDGTLRIQTASAATSQAERDSVVAYAKEAVDNSGGTAAARIKVEVA